MIARPLRTLAVALVAATAALSVAQAALAPKYDRLKQFEAVLSPQVLDALGERPIDRIVRRADGVFVVHGGECLVFVTLAAIPPKDGMAGPTTYAIAEISPMACK